MYLSIYIYSLIDVTTGSRLCACCPINCHLQPPGKILWRVVFRSSWLWSHRSKYNEPTDRQELFLVDVACHYDVSNLNTMERGMLMTVVGWTGKVVPMRYRELSRRPQPEVMLILPAACNSQAVITFPPTSLCDPIWSFASMGGPVFWVRWIKPPELFCCLRMSRM